MDTINLNGLKMTVVETAPNGVVNRDTLFFFNQHDDHLFANYAGGKILKGFLVGKVKGSTLKFAYCQVQSDGTLDHGESIAELVIHEGKIRLVEHFEWGSRPGERGTNIFEAC